MDVQAIQADFVMADAHKWMLGPEGIALFYTGSAVREQLALHQYGWHMVENAGNYEDKTWTPARSGRRFECGSNNLMGIHALSASLSLLEEIGMDRIEESVLDNSRYLLDRLKGVQGIELITPDRANAYAGIVSFRIPGKDPETVHRALLEKAVICACRGGGIRFSPHFYIGRELLDKALEILSVSIWFNE
jgi:selenocysteine lyase/cysteine desulfurase